MKRLIVISTLVLLLPVWSVVHAQTWSIAGRIGGAVMTQDIEHGTEGDPGFLLNGRALYHLTPGVRLGVDLDWSNHDVDLDGVGRLGDANIFSILPVVEFHPIAFTIGAVDPAALLSPYGVFGMGINVNSFDGRKGLELDPDNTLAVKAGAGLDVRLLPRLYLNGELAYKFNIGDAKFKGPGFSVDRDFRASTFQFLLGVRFAF